MDSISYILEAKGINKFYANNLILDNVNLKVAKKEVLGIVGASGCGKTTLLNILSSLEKADSGEIFINSVNICQLTTDDLALFRNKSIGIVFQFSNLLSEFSILENVAMPAYIAGMSRFQANKKALELMSSLGIDHLKNHSIKQLSGGQAQRAVFARAMINDPFIIFADEPSGSLDSNNAHQLHELIFRLREDYNRTFVISTHNLDFSKSMDRVVEINFGTLLERRINKG